MCQNKVKIKLISFPKHTVFSIGYKGVYVKYCYHVYFLYSPTITHFYVGQAIDGEMRQFNFSVRNVTLCNILRLHEDDLLTKITK